MSWRDILGFTVAVIGMIGFAACWIAAMCNPNWPRRRP